MILSSIKNHTPLIVMLFGAASSFLMNTHIKNNYSPSDYSLFVLVMIGVMYMSSGAFLGSDSVLLRHAQTIGKSIQVPVNLLVQMLISIILSYIFISIYMLKFLKTFEFTILIFVVPWCLLFMQLCKALASRLLGQISSQLWKITAYISLLYTLHTDSHVTFASILNYSSAVALILVVIAFYLSGNRVNITRKEGSNTDNIKMQIAYSLGIIILFFYESIDRIVLSSVIDVSTFSEYAYFITILIFPINIISGYIGFYLFPVFKKSISNTRNILIALNFLAILGAGIYISLILLFNEYIGVTIFWSMIPAVIGIILIKISYPVFSVILTVAGNSNDMLKINYMCAIALAVAGLLSYLTSSIPVALYSILSLWLLRLTLFYNYSKKYY